MSYLVGLTGGIGSGKSVVAEMFAQCGAIVIDSDEISHKLTQPEGAAIEAIRSAFGDNYLCANGALNRPLMRQRVFSDSSAKQRLEEILHPLILSQMLAQVNVSAKDSSYSLLVIPLLFEKKSYRQLVQRTLVVDCAEETQIARTMQRSKLSENEVCAIMTQQISRADRLRHADDTLKNDAGLDLLQLQVLQLHQRYIALSAGSD
jgi:dephospho-CoA kinase